MADPEDPAEAAERLESALERIASLAVRAQAAAAEARAHSSTPLEYSRLTVTEAGEAVELASRLDVIIGRLRAALAKPPGP